MNSSSQSHIDSTFYWFYRYYLCSSAVLKLNKEAEEDRSSAGMPDTAASASAILLQCWHAWHMPCKKWCQLELDMIGNEVFVRGSCSAVVQRFQVIGEVCCCLSGSWGRG